MKAAYCLAETLAEHKDSAPPALDVIPGFIPGIQRDAAITAGECCF
ncbi:hypothetical protein [Pelagibacterium sediminicola]|nr:hypothetical protein [Pelagibacterium sediminicola]